MQDHPGAPGTARQESTRIIVSTNDGGNATQPRAPGHERPPAALSAARHGRLSAATGAPGADVPLASTAGAPGQYCLSAAPRAPGHDVSLASPVRAPGHDRLSAAPIATVSLPAGLQPAAPGSLAPRPCHSQHSDLLALPLHRTVIPAPTGFRACARQPARGATCCARPPVQRRDPELGRFRVADAARPPAQRGGGGGGGP